MNLLVFLDVNHAIPLVTESLGRVVPTELLDEVGRTPGDLSRELDHVYTLQDDVVRFHGVVGSKRGTEDGI